MSFARCIDTAIILPARNEAERIESCLDALAPQCDERVQIILVVNNTDDATAQIAQSAAQGMRINLQILDVTYPAEFGVGEGRRRGAAQALQTLPHLRHLLTTDADCRVAPDWVACSRHHLKTADAVCGKVDFHPSETAWIAGLDRALQDSEAAYRTLVQEVFARHAPNCADLRGSHGQAPGASLGFTRAAYVIAGGFAAIPCGEDRQIIRTLRSLGMQVRHASDLRVAASCRLKGRAVGGMADTLRARLSGEAYTADDCLPRADQVMQQARLGQLTSWPPKVAPQDCVPVQELTAHIAKLKNFLANSKPAHAAALPPQGLASVPTASGRQAIYAAPVRDG